MGERQPPPDIGGLISLKVDNIPFTMTKMQLQEIFQEHGDVSASIRAHKPLNASALVCLRPPLLSHCRAFARRSRTATFPRTI